MAADRLTGKLTFEQSPEGGEGVRHADMWGRNRWGTVSKEEPRRTVGEAKVMQDSGSQTLTAPESLKSLVKDFIYLVS